MTHPDDYILMHDRIAELEEERKRLRQLVLEMVALGDKAHGTDPYHVVCHDMYELGARCLNELGVPTKPVDKPAMGHEGGGNE